jgi:general secretion pathway protein G
MRRRILGVTLVELLVTLAIVAMLSSIVVPMAGVLKQRQQEQDLRIALRQIRDAIDAYKEAYDQGHVLKTQGASGYPASLDVLVDGIEDAKDPGGRRKIFFLRRLPRDPFHTDFSTPAAATWGLRAYSSEPDDPQQGEDVYDVFSLSVRTGLNGVPYASW